MADGSVMVDRPTSLAEYESLIEDKDTNRKVMVHGIRSYMPFFDRAAYIPGNDGTGDKGIIITGYPEGDTHAYNEGWGSEVVTGNSVRYTAQMRDSSSIIDYRQWEHQPEADRNSWRFRRDEAFLRGFARAMVRDVFYGDPAKDPRKMKGFFNIVKPDDAVWGSRCINAGGTTANRQTSISLMAWDPAHTYLFHPANGAKAGMDMVDNGKQRIEPEAGKHYWGLETDFHWECGLALYQPLAVARVYNIDCSKLSKSNATAGSPDLIDLMVRALDSIPSEYRGRHAFYMPQSIASVLHRQLMNKANMFLTMSDFEGRQNVLQFMGVPIVELGTDVLSVTDAVI